MTSHVTLSPSKRFQFSACAGSVREQAKYPDQGSGPAAIDGTHTHTLLDTCIKTGLPPDAFVGQILKDHEGEFTVDQARADRVKVATDYVANVSPPGAKVLAETRVEPEWLWVPSTAAAPDSWSGYLACSRTDPGQAEN